MARDGEDSRLTVWRRTFPAVDALEKLQSSLAGRYAVVREVGAGGMATVFLARDVKHDRHVALKVLRAELGAVLGVERFLSEIKVTAHLQHPHLLPLFDSGEADGLLFYVMPFVEGESLRARLDAEHQLPIEEALRITLAVASALEYAHKQGVIHRDLKPENILLQHGEPMVSDFGIALAVSNAGGARVTQTGLSLGTPQYMSPEQATGDRVVDARSDIYSLAAVFYEMLTGEPPHSGKTAQAIIARVLTEKANSTRAMRDTVPEHIDAAVLKALSKLPADRFASAAEFSAVLKNPSIMAAGAVDGSRARGGDRAAANGRVPIGTGGSRAFARGVFPWVVALVGAGFGLASWMGFGLRPAGGGAADAVVRFTVALPSSVGFVAANSALAISPDGSAIVVGSPPQRSVGLFIRTLDNPQLVRLAGTEGAGLFAAFSPDGAWIAFNKGTTLMKVPRGGGPVVTIAEGVSASAGFAWEEGDRIVFSKVRNTVLARWSNGLWTMSSMGADARQLTTLDSATEVGQGTPSPLPGGRAVLFATVNNGGGLGQIAVATLDGKVTRLGIDGASPQYTDDGHLVFFDLAGSVMSVPFDLRSLRITGAATPLVQGVASRTGRTGQWAVSRNGTLVYNLGTFASTLVSVDRSGEATPLYPEARGYRRPRVSPDGRRVVVEVGDGRTAGSGGKVDLWMLERGSGTISRFTFGLPSSDPVWTRDGKRVAYARSEASGIGSDIFWQAADGSGAAEPLYEAPGSQWPYGFTPDDKTLVFNQNIERGAVGGIYTVGVGEKLGKPLFTSEFSNRLPDLSPDGKWVTYASNESGRVEIYVRPFPGPGGKWAVSTGGGDQPLWNPNGREIFYRDGTNVIAASVSTSPTFAVLSRKVLFEDPYENAGTEDWHVFPDGNHFAMVRPVNVEAQLMVAMNALSADKASARK